MKMVYNDSAHTYTLDGKRCKSVTAVASIPVDKFNIEQWGKRMVAIGMTLDPNLIEKVAVDLDNKDTIQAVCEDAQETAKAHLKADRGTQMHRASEFVDLERTDLLLTDQQKRDAAAWSRTIDAYQIEMIPGFIEGFVAYPAHNVTGRFDRVARIGAVGGATAVVDLKSGENAVLYPQSTCVQLALYANAPHVSKTVTTVGDRSTVTTWQTMPDGLDLDNAYIILLRPDADLGELWRVDIGHGQLGARYALELVEWRKAHNYGKALSAQVHPTLPTLEPLADRRLDLRRRYLLLNEHDQAKFRGLMIDPDDLDLIETHLNALDAFQTVNVEPVLQIDKPKFVVAATSQTKVVPIPEPSMGEMEGDAAPDAGWMFTAQRFDALTADHKAWIKRIVAEAHEAQVWMSGYGNKTTRRHDLLRGLVCLACNGQDDDELVRLIVATVIDSDTPLMASFTVGQGVGSLNAGEASRFDALCQAFCAGELEASVSDDGTMRLIPAA